MIGDHAINYASQLKWAVFPVEPRDKRPYPTGGLKDNGEPFRLRWGSCATNDLRRIRQWWKQWPNANIGLACKPSGLVVIDADLEGAVNWERFERDNALPSTVTANTPSGGKHIIYKIVEGVVIGNRDLMNGVNVRGIKGDGGYIVVAPSIHPNSKIYKWADGLSPFEIEIAKIPQALIEALKPRPIQQVQMPVRNAATDDYQKQYAYRFLDWKLRDVRNSTNGHKHNVLNVSAFLLGQYVGQGLLTDSEVRQSLLSAATSNGIKDTEADRVISDGLKAGRSNSGQLVIPTYTESRLRQIRSAVSHE